MRKFPAKEIELLGEFGERVIERLAEHRHRLTPADVGLVEVDVDRLLLDECLRVRDPGIDVAALARLRLKNDVGGGVLHPHNVLE